MKDNIGYLLTLSSKLLKNKLNQNLENLNITAAQWAVIKHLQILTHNEAPTQHFTAVEISKKLDMDKPTMSGVLNRLIEKKYIVKKAHPQDRRAQVIELTNLCYSVIPQLEVVSSTTINMALRDIGEDEEQILTHILNKMITNLKGE